MDGSRQGIAWTVTVIFFVALLGTGVFTGYRVLAPAPRAPTSAAQASPSAFSTPKPTVSSNPFADGYVNPFAN